MAEAGTLHDAFIDELRDTYDAEKQLTKALPKLAKAASDPTLRQAFESHLEETRRQIARLEQVFESLDEKVRGKHCDGIAGIIEEGKAVMEEDFDETTMDACLIASGQRAEHYEMAAYGTLVAWATAMGHTDAARLLQETLDEEKAADEKLSSLAEGGINQAAAGAGQPDEEEDEPAAVGAGAKKTAAAKAKKPARGASTGGVVVLIRPSPRSRARPWPNALPKMLPVVGTALLPIDVINDPARRTSPGATPARSASDTCSSKWTAAHDRASVYEQGGSCEVVS